MNKRFLTFLVLIALLACSGDGGSTGNAPPPPPAPPVPAVPVITVPATGLKGQSYQATTPVQTGMTFTWGITNGTITSGGSTPNVTFTADAVGNLGLTCVARNSANVASATATATMVVSDPTPPPPTSWPGVFRPLKDSTPVPAIQGAASMPSGPTAMGTARVFHTATQLPNGRIVTLGGTNMAGEQLGIDVFDPTIERFTTTGGHLNAGRTRHAAVLLDNGTIALIGGGAPFVDVYDPVTDTCTNVMAFDAQRNQSQAINIGDHRVLVYGGYDASGYFNPVIIDTLTWTQRTLTTEAKHQRINFALVTLKNGKVLVIGGSKDATMYSDVISFDPTTEQFTALGAMTMPRAGHSALELPNGQIGIYGGGTNAVGLQKSTETIDLATNVCTLGGDMIGAKGNMLSVCLQNGFTLHVGGLDDLGYVTNTQMIYDPASKASGYTASMLSSRKDFTLTVMPNGCYLVTGGQNTTDGILATAEVFDPQTEVNITYPSAVLPNADSVQLTASGNTTGLVWTCDAGTVDQTGKYTSPDMGDPTAVAYITATNGTGKKAVVRMAILKNIVTVTGLESIPKDSKSPYTATVVHYSDKTVTWTSDKGTIDASGVLDVTGIQTGTVIYVTAKSLANTALSDTFKVVVVP